MHGIEQRIVLDDAVVSSKQDLSLIVASYEPLNEEHNIAKLNCKACLQPRIDPEIVCISFHTCHSQRHIKEWWRDLQQVCQ